MSIPELARRGAEAKVSAFCEGRIPPHARDQIRLEHVVRGNAITIVERRPPWDGVGDEWTSLTIAQMRFDEPSATWTLWWSDRNGRWHRYDDLKPTPDLELILWEIDVDPTANFWG